MSNECRLFALPDALSMHASAEPHAWGGSKIPRTPFDASFRNPRYAIPAAIDALLQCSIRTPPIMNAPGYHYAPFSSISAGSRCRASTFFLYSTWSLSHSRAASPFNGDALSLTCKHTSLNHRIHNLALTCLARPASSVCSTARSPYSALHSTHPPYPPHLA